MKRWGEPPGLGDRGGRLEKGGAVWGLGLDVGQAYSGAPLLPRLCSPCCRPTGQAGQVGRTSKLAAIFGLKLLLIASWALLERLEGLGRPGSGPAAI